MVWIWDKCARVPCAISAATLLLRWLCLSKEHRAGWVCKADPHRVSLAASNKTSTPAQSRGGSWVPWQPALSEIEGPHTGKEISGAQKSCPLPCTSTFLSCRSKHSCGMVPVPRKDLRCTGGRIQFPRGWGETGEMALQSRRWLWSSEQCYSWEEEGKDVL